MNGAAGAGLKARRDGGESNGAMSNVGPPPSTTPVLVFGENPDFRTRTFVFIRPGTFKSNVHHVFIYIYTNMYIYVRGLMNIHINVWIKGYIYICLAEEATSFGRLDIYIYISVIFKYVYMCI